MRKNIPQKKATLPKNIPKKKPHYQKKKKKTLNKAKQKTTHLWFEKKIKKWNPINKNGHFMSTTENTFD